MVFEDQSIPRNCGARHEFDNVRPMTRHDFDGMNRIVSVFHNYLAHVSECRARNVHRHEIRTEKIPDHTGSDKKAIVRRAIIGISVCSNMYLCVPHITQQELVEAEQGRTQR